MSSNAAAEHAGTNELIFGASYRKALVRGAIPLLLWTLYATWNGLWMLEVAFSLAVLFALALVCAASGYFASRRCYVAVGPDGLHIKSHHSLEPGSKRFTWREITDAVITPSYGPGLTLEVRSGDRFGWIHYEALAEPNALLGAVKRFAGADSIVARGLEDLALQVMRPEASRTSNGEQVFRFALARVLRRDVVMITVVSGVLTFMWLMFRSVYFVPYVALALAVIYQGFRRSYVAVASDGIRIKAPFNELKRFTWDEITDVALVRSGRGKTLEVRAGDRFGWIHCELLAGPDLFADSVRKLAGEQSLLYRRLHEIEHSLRKD